MQADRKPDLLAGRLVDVIYAHPADGANRFASLVTPIVSDVAAIDAWWRRLDPGRTLRFDLYPFAGCTSTIGALDIADVTLPQPAETFADRPVLADRAGPLAAALPRNEPAAEIPRLLGRAGLRRARLRPGERDRHRDHLPAGVRAHRGERRPERGRRRARVDPCARRRRLRLAARVSASERRPRVRRHDGHPLSVPELRSRRAVPRRQPRRLLRVRRRRRPAQLPVARATRRSRSSRSRSRPAAPARDGSRATPARSTAPAPARRPRSKDSR